jgi:hypothetical protein
VSGIDANVDRADGRISGNVDLRRRPLVKRDIRVDAENGVEVRWTGWSDANGNDHGAVDLATGNFEQSCQRDRCHPAHTSETHRHPEEEVLVRMIEQNRLL